MALRRLHVTSGGRTRILWSWTWSTRQRLLWLTIESIGISWSAQLVLMSRPLSTHWVALVLHFTTSSIKLNTILVNPSYRWIRWMIISGSLFVGILSWWILVPFFCGLILLFISQFAVYTIQKVFFLLLVHSRLISTGFHSRPLLVDNVDLSSSNVEIAVDFS